MKEIYKYCFIVPNPSELTSGGNLYNCHLLNGLRAEGVSVCQVELAEYNTKKATAICIWDSIYINDFGTVEIDYTKAVFLIHHLPSLELSNIENEKYFFEKEASIINKFKQLLVTSEFLKRYLIERGIAEKKITVIPPALCFKAEPIKQETNKIEAILVANLIPRKGILPFLKALQKGKINKANIKIKLLGSTKIDPAYAKACLQLLATDTLKDIIEYSGDLPHKKLQELYQKSNLFISTSFMETYGMALQEAVAYRLPILAQKGGNIANHILPTINGFVFEDLLTLVQEIKILSSNPKQFKTLYQSTWNHRSQEKYTWKTATQLFQENILRDLTDN